MKKHCTAIVLSAGQGKRMHSSVQKQYIELEGKPILYYSLKAFENSGIIDDIVLVAGAGQEEYVRREILEKYGITKASKVVCGGKERYDSVYEGLQALDEKDGYVFIHDGARPFVDEEILKRGYDAVKKYRACAAGMPSKDTVKIADEHAFAVQTPERSFVWTVQTPQVFDITLITEAYSRLMREECIKATDDAMAVEQMMQIRVKLFQGAYENIKITTPEDLAIAGALLKRRGEKR